MVALAIEEDLSAKSSRAHKYRIHLKLSPADREDAWDLCRIAQDLGGVEVSDC